MHPSNLVSYFSLFRFSAVFSIFLRGKTLPCKNKSGLAKRAFATVRPGQAHPVFYRRSHNVCILRIAPIVSPSRFLAVFSIFSVGKHPHAKAKAAFQNPLFRGSPVPGTPRFL